jgi:HAD superfamily hydrolase (TIGR01509 family)
VKALLFDFDGTLVDTEGPAFRSWQEVYEELGHELPLSRWSRAIGTVNGFDALAHLEEVARTPIDRDGIRERRLRRERELVAAEALRPGVEHYLRDALELGLAVGIVSSSSDGWISGILERVAGSEHWDCIVTANGDPLRAKPSPLLYREALGCLGLGPEEAVAFEDSPNGIAAAKAAGLFCVAVPNPVTAGFDLSGADLRLESFEDVPLAELLRRVAPAWPARS